MSKRNQRNMQKVAKNQTGRPGTSRSDNAFMGRPTGLDVDLPIIRKLTPEQEPPSFRTMRRLGQIQPGTQVYKMGKLRIFLSPPTMTDVGLRGWHMTLSGPGRYPNWDEIVKARYELLPDDVVMVQVLPPLADYININEYTFQLLQVLGENVFVIPHDKLPEPDEQGNIEFEVAGNEQTYTGQPIPGGELSDLGRLGVKGVKVEQVDDVLPSEEGSS